MAEIPLHQDLFDPPVRKTEAGIPGNETFGPEDIYWETKTLEPRRFDNYQGPLEKLETKLIHVGVVDDQDKDNRYVMRLVAIDNPYFKEEELKEGQEARTLYVMGGGLSDAVTGLGIAANMMDADNLHSDGNFRIKNVVILSHPDDQPRNVKHTDPDGEQSSLTHSARIVEKALRQTTGDADAKPIKPSEHVMMIGHSAGAQMSMELARDLGIEELILMEPTGMSDLPKLTDEFGKGTLKAAFQDAQREGARTFLSTVKRTSDVMLHAFTDAYGPYKHGWLSFLRFLPGREKLPFLPQSFKDKIRAGHRFGIPKPFLPANPNPHSLDHDSTQEQRAEFHGKVTLVNELQSYVANLLISKAGFTREELAEFDQIISQIAQQEKSDIQLKPTLDETKLPPEMYERFYKRIAQGPTSLLTELFPNAKQRRIILDQGFTHFRMLQDATFYARLMEEVKSPTE